MPFNSVYNSNGLSLLLRRNGKGMPFVKPKNDIYLENNYYCWVNRNHTMFMQILKQLHYHNCCMDSV